MFEYESTSSEMTDRLKLYWNDLSYKPCANYNKKKNNKLIINGLNGEITSGQLTGILGPSGSGKTTLIECLAGKRRAGLSGRVWVKNTNVKKSEKSSIAYNCQTDALIAELTVEEALKYASELKKIRSKRYDFFNTNDENYKNNNNSHNITNNKHIIHTVPEEQEPLAQEFSHDLNVRNMIEVFGLNQCSGVKTSSISGGQKKRLSIALELIFSPNILLLDEPTTGLDSVSSFQCLSLLKTLSYNKDPLVIAVSIHQPTARLLSFFDCIYVLSIDGQCVYSGPTDRLVTHLSGFGLICPIFHNPADYVIEISSGGHGSDIIDKLAEYERQKYLPKLNAMSFEKHESIGSTNSDNECNRSLSEELIDMWILVKRSTIISLRNPLVYWLRIVGMLMSLGAKMVIYYHGQGQSDGDICSDSHSVIDKITSIAVKGRDIHKSFKSLQNITYIMTLTLFIHMCTVAPTLMTFPIELSTFVKEHFNKWYTSWSYFMSKSIVDIPAVVVIPIIYASLLWYITDQIWDLWRFSGHLIVVLCLALVSHSIGLLLSAFFVNNIRGSLLSFSIFVTPFLLFSGFLIPIQTMPYFLQIFSYLSIFRLTFESILILIYGFNRCLTPVSPLTLDHLSHGFGFDVHLMDDCFEGVDSLSNLTTNSLKAFNKFLFLQNPSKMLEYYRLKDSDLYLNISLLIIYSIILRILAFYALKWRVKIK